MDHGTRRARLRGLAILLLAAHGTALGQQLYWYDGGQRRPLWTEPSVQADFSEHAAEKSRVLKPSAMVKDTGARHSPVLRDGKSEGSPQRALPGGVIVRFHAGATEPQRQALIARHGLAPVRQLGDASGLWLMHSEPGLPALELANRLYESGDFAAASPNWWRPRAHK